MASIKSDNPSFVLHGIDTVKYEDVSGFLRLTTFQVARQARPSLGYAHLYSDYNACP